MDATPSYLPDREVDATTDAELRGLLTLCFGAGVFVDQRYAERLPEHRWVVRCPHGGLVAQAALHDVVLGTSAGDLPVGALAEVCVHPEVRRRGLARAVVMAALTHLRQRGVPFAILFGRAEFYQRFGFRPAANPLRHFKGGRWRDSCREPTFQYLPLADQPWPTGPIDLRGPML